jgi:hypothetical protein
MYNTSFDSLAFGGGFWLSIDLLRFYYIILKKEKEEAMVAIKDCTVAGLNIVGVILTRIWISDDEEINRLKEMILKDKNLLLEFKQGLGEISSEEILILQKKVPEILQLC